MLERFNRTEGPPMSQIEIEHDPSEQRLTELGVREWPVWSKEVSRFPWEYDARETCYLLEGEVLVTPEGGKPVLLRAGDLVTFRVGLLCTWDIRKAVRKHYTFG
jgi:uncharacterized cupin superfamily protein